MASSGLKPAANNFEVSENDVNCPTASTCFVVGNYTEGVGFQKNYPLVETWTSGSWAGTVLPTGGLRPAWKPSFTTALESVSCPTSRSCLAVGGYGQFEGGVSGPLVEMYKDGHWTGSNGPGYLQRVICFPNGTCLAVGEKMGGDTAGGLTAYEDEGGPIAAEFAHGSWVTTRLALPGIVPSATAGRDAVLQALSCPVQGYCVALGSYTDSSGATTGLIETLKDGQWQAANVPLSGLVPAAADNQSSLAPENAWELACLSPSFCVAVAQYKDDQGNQHGLIETWSGGKWAARVAPGTGSGTLNAGQNGLSCPTASFCAASFQVLGPKATEYTPLAELWNGSQWTASVPSLSGVDPAPGAKAREEFYNGSGDQQLVCAAPGSCVMAGTYKDAAKDTEGFFEVMQAGHWVASNLPVTGLGCISSGQVLALAYAPSGPYVATGNCQDGSATVGVSWVGK
jgi:hypothetical protein